MFYKKEMKQKCILSEDIKHNMIFVNSCNLSKSSLMHVRRRVLKKQLKQNLKKKLRNGHGNKGD
jgi:hypothetical protein